MDKSYCRIRWLAFYISIKKITSPGPVNSRWFVIHSVLFLERKYIPLHKMPIGAKQVTSHYLNQRWSGLITQIGIGELAHIMHDADSNYNTWNKIIAIHYKKRNRNTIHPMIQFASSCMVSYVFLNVDTGSLYESWAKYSWYKITFWN